MGDAAAIDLELRLAGPARADSAAQTREIRAGADQVRLAVAQLREFHLQLAVAAARVPRKHVEDDHRAVDDRDGNDELEVLALPRTEVVEDEHEVRTAFLDRVGDLARLSAADERRRVDRVAPLHHPREDRRARRLHERFELVQLRLERTFRIVEIDGNENAALRPRERRRLHDDVCVVG